MRRSGPRQHGGEERTAAFLPVAAARILRPLPRSLFPEAAAAGPSGGTLLHKHFSMLGRPEAR